MRYYILRTNGENLSDSSNINNKYNFKITNLNAERLLSDAKDDDIFYLLYNIPEKKFVEKGLIKAIASHVPSNKFQAYLTNRSNLDIVYTPYASPNCGIIPTSKQKIQQILNIAM